MNPTEEEVLGCVETLRNWDRWGPDDELGTLNFITPEKRVAAAREVRTGRTVSLAHDLTTHSQPNNPQPAAHMMLMTGGGGSRDYIGVACHGFTTTHVDAFCHVHWEGAMWNGRPFFGREAPRSHVEFHQCLARRHRQSRSSPRRSGRSRGAVARSQRSGARRGPQCRRGVRQCPRRGRRHSGRAHGPLGAPGRGGVVGARVLGSGLPGVVGAPRTPCRAHRYEA